MNNGHQKFRCPRQVAGVWILLKWYNNTFVSPSCRIDRESYNFNCSILISFQRSNKIPDYIYIYIYLFHLSLSLSPAPSIHVHHDEYFFWVYMCLSTFVVVQIPFSTIPVPWTLLPHCHLPVSEWAISLTSQLFWWKPVAGNSTIHKDLCPPTPRVQLQGSKGSTPRVQRFNSKGGVQIWGGQTSGIVGWAHMQLEPMCKYRTLRLTKMVKFLQFPWKCFFLGLSKKISQSISTWN